MQVPVATHPPHGEAARALASRIGEALPPSLVTLWRESGAGVLLVSPEIDRPYLEPGRVAWRHVRCRGGLFVPLEPEPAALWEVIGGWLDLFGGGHVSGARLSGGGGVTPSLGVAARRLVQILHLGYSLEPEELRTPDRVFARAVARYQLDPGGLAAIDPPLVRWFRGTLFNEGFWRRVRGEWAAGNGATGGASAR